VNAMGEITVKRPGETSADSSTQLAHTRTELALERTAMGAERTLQAWIRTALSMISFGFTIGKLGQAIHEVEVKGILQLSSRTVGIESLAYFLVVLGTSSLAIATFQHWVAIRQLRARGLPRTISLPVLVANLLVLVGGGAFMALVLKL